MDSDGEASAWAAVEVYLVRCKDCKDAPLDNMVGDSEANDTMFVGFVWPRYSDRQVTCKIFSY